MPQSRRCTVSAPIITAPQLWPRRHLHPQTISKTHRRTPTIPPATTQVNRRQDLIHVTDGMMPSDRYQAEKVAVSDPVTPFSVSLTLGGSVRESTMQTFSDVLSAAGTRPLDTAPTTAKKNYSQRLSEGFALLMANKLRTADPIFRDILPSADGRGQESRSVSGANKKLKKTDVRYSTRDGGLELLASIKTLNFKNSKIDRKSRQLVVGRYTKNMVRNDHELRAEAMEHHERFPYAVLAAIFLIPADSCDDGVQEISSFAHAILTFRPRAGRVYPTDPRELFE